MRMTRRIEELQAEIDYYHDRVALLRAKLYRWGEGSTARLRQLEASLETARQRMREARSRGER
jgi:prefoldin subunit 5